MNLGRVWGRRPYAGKEARELLNDLSRDIAREQPDTIDDSDDPSLADVVQYADERGAGRSVERKTSTLTDLMRHGLTFQEAVCWYWFRYAKFDLMEIHFAQEGISKGGDPAHQRNSVRNIQRVLESAAFKLPDASPDDVPDLDVDQQADDADADDVEAAD